MQDFPHYYAVTATGQESSDIEIGAEQLPSLNPAPPAEYGGPGNKWSAACRRRCRLLHFNFPRHRLRIKRSVAKSD